MQISRMFRLRISGERRNGSTLLQGTTRRLQTCKPATVYPVRSTQTFDNQLRLPLPRNQRQSKHSDKFGVNVCYAVKRLKVLSIMDLVRFLVRCGHEYANYTFIACILVGYPRQWYSKRMSFQGNALTAARFGWKLTTVYFFILSRRLG